MAVLHGILTKEDVFSEVAHDAELISLWRRILDACRSVAPEANKILVHESDCFNVVISCLDGWIANLSFQMHSKSAIFVLMF